MLSEKVLDQTRSDAPDQSMGALFSQLATQSSELVRDEFALAKHEVRDKLKSLGVAAVICGLAALIGQAALIALAAAAALALAPVVGTWQAVLIVGGILLVVASALGAVAARLARQLDLRPKQTLETLEEDKEWLKELT
jgi:uncharacterized membrane protein YqjE